MKTYFNHNPKLHISMVKTQLVICRLLLDRAIAEKRYDDIVRLVQEFVTILKRIESYGNK
jgi:hypothetical protein